MRHVFIGTVLLLVTASLQAATVDGLNVHSTTSGTGETTVILVHGYTCDESTWSEQVPALSAKYRVITLDLPGHGKSDVPVVEKFSMDLFARAIEAVRVESRADRVVVVGHSMGTPVILRYAKLYPQHVAALVLVDGLMVDGPPTPGAGAAMGGPDGRKHREALIQRFFVPTTPPAVRERVSRMMLSAPEATAVGAMNASVETAGRIEQIPPGVPVLAMYAGSPLAGRQVVLSHVPQAEYIQIADTGHFLMLERPAEFNRVLLEFLAKQTIGR